MGSNRVATRLCACMLYTVAIIRGYRAIKWHVFIFARRTVHYCLIVLQIVSISYLHTGLSLCYVYQVNYNNSMHRNEVQL